MAADFPFREQEDQRPSGARYEFFQTIAGSPDDPEEAYPVEGDPDADPSTQPTKYYAQMLRNVTFTDVVGVGGLTYDTTDKKRVIFNLQADAYIEENSVVLCFLKNGKWFTIDKVPADTLRGWYLAGLSAPDGFKIRRRETDGTTAWSINPHASISQFRIAASSYGRAPYLFATGVVSGGTPPENVFRINAETGDVETSWTGPRTPTVIVCEKSANHTITIANDPVTVAENNLNRYQSDGSLVWSVKLFEHNGAQYLGSISSMAVLRGGDLVLIARMLAPSNLFRADYLIRIDRNTGAELWRTATLATSLSVSAYTINCVDHNDNIWGVLTDSGAPPANASAYTSSGTAITGSGLGPRTTFKNLAIDADGHLVMASTPSVVKYDISTPSAPTAIWSIPDFGGTRPIGLRTERQIVFLGLSSADDEYIYDLDGNSVDHFNAHGAAILASRAHAGPRDFD